jgi:putative transposase
MELSDEKVKKMFLQVLKRAKNKFSFKIFNFSIMNNHYHLIILPGENQNLSLIMQWINSVFARKYNKLMGYSGHLWGERFFSRIIKTFQDFENTSHYIANNPVSAGLVQNPEHWVFSGLYHIVKKIYFILDPYDTFGFT